MAHVVVVGLALEVGNPPTVDLDERDPDIGEPVQDAAEDELEHAEGGIVEVPGAGQGLCPLAPHLAAHQPDVNGDRHPRRLDGLPYRVVLGLDRQVAVRIPLHEEGDEAGHR